MPTTSFRLIAAAALLLAACTRDAPRIDMTNAETATESMATVRDSLPDEEKARFADATSVLVLHALGPDREAAARNPEKSEAAVREALDGKTAAQVIAEAEDVRAQGGAASP